MRGDPGLDSLGNRQPGTERERLGKEPKGVAVEQEGVEDACLCPPILSIEGLTKSPFLLQKPFRMWAALSDWKGRRHKRLEGRRLRGGAR